MGEYLNSGGTSFAKARSSQLYVDKSSLLSYTNRVLGTMKRYVYVSRPNGFGKSMSADMLTAYYQKGTDSDNLFGDLEIARDPDYRTYLNQYDTISLNMQKFILQTHDAVELIKLIEKSVTRELITAYPNVDYFDQADLSDVLQDIYAEKKLQFVFIIDDWDCVLQNMQNDREKQKAYHDFFITLLKDRSYIAFVYMTGLLPIKKFGTQSSLNMFDEFTMISSGRFSKYMGFTGQEALTNQELNNGSMQIEECDVLKHYIGKELSGLKDSVRKLLADAKIRINVGMFCNDMTTFRSADDVLTLLVHLGYLAYDGRTEEAYIPNPEKQCVFDRAAAELGW